jgi:hypothetical protein
MQRPDWFLPPEEQQPGSSPSPAAEPAGNTATTDGFTEIEVPGDELEDSFLSTGVRRWTLGMIAVAVVLGGGVALASVNDAPVEVAEVERFAPPRARTVEPVPAAPAVEPVPVAEAPAPPHARRAVLKPFNLRARARLPTPKVTVKDLAAPFLIRGGTFFRNGQLLRALAMFRRATELAAGNPEGWYGVALCSYELRRDKDSAAAANRALLSDPTHPMSNLLAGYLAQADQKFAAARTHYSRYLNAEPNGVYAEELISVLQQLPEQ